MSAKTTNDQSVTDDQELAKVLAGNATQQKANVNDALGGLQFEESPVPTGTTSGQNASSTGTSANTTPTITPSPSATTAAANSTSTSTTGTANTSAAQTSPSSTATSTAPSSGTTASSAGTAPTTPLPSLADLGAISASGGASGSLDSIKKDALEELRPLVDKLNLPAEEKFDTLLLIIRSTDDQSLLGPAHDAAKAIQDESRRAQALLDVIKEIDYFSAGGQTAS